LGLPPVKRITVGRPLAEEQRAIAGGVPLGAAGMQLLQQRQHAAEHLERNIFVRQFHASTVYQEKSKAHYDIAPHPRPGANGVPNGSVFLAHLLY
jgi:hypothetical protein